jgi:hypothetical protein
MITGNRRGCCSGSPLKIAYIRVKGSSAGMTGLEEIFEQVHRAGRPDGDALERELVEQAGVYNYIAPGSESDYGWALRRAYQAYVRSKEKGESQTAVRAP